MRKYLFFLLIFLALSLQAEPKYFPIGTKWTELRLDTTKYDNWYTKSGDEWIPNFERIDYYVKDVFPLDRTKYDYPHDMYTIYCQREGKLDSLCYLVREYRHNPRPDILASDTVGYDVVLASIPYEAYAPNTMLYPQCLCTFGDWEIGLRMVATRLITSVSMAKGYNLGLIQEIGDEDFGGVRKQKYCITDKGNRFIDGIGITAWAGPDCIFGPSEIEDALGIYYPGDSPYCTILVRFERDGEVLYNVWPEPGNENTIGRPTSNPSLVRDGIYDLQGRRLPKAPQKGMYIKDGKKVVKK